MGIPIPDISAAWEESNDHYSFENDAGKRRTNGSLFCIGYAAVREQREKEGCRQAAVKRDADVEDAVSGVWEKQGEILTERESKGLSDREPVESVLPDAMSSPAGKEIAVQEDGRTEEKAREKDSGTAEELRQTGVPRILPVARRVGAEPHGLK